MVVQHNLTAMNANRYLGINNTKLSKSLEKLSSGYAINRAGDNAAGLAVSEKMRSQIAGMTQGVKNAQDAISMIQTYEGALTETDSILQRMKVLADQAGNGTYQDDVDRDAIQLEFNQLNDELNQIADTDFNGVVALNGGVMADGTVANNTDVVSKTPTITYSQNGKPNAAVAYSENVNGTINASGGGSVNVNGVRIKTNAGAGKYTETDGSEYEVKNLTVKNGQINATITGDATTASITAKEVYKAKKGANDITINGTSYTLKWDIQTTYNYTEADGSKSVKTQADKDAADADVTAKNAAKTAADNDLLGDPSNVALQAAQAAAAAALTAAQNEAAKYVKGDDIYALTDIVDANGNSLVNDITGAPTAVENAGKAGFNAAVTLDTAGDGSATITTTATYNVDANGNVTNANSGATVGTIELNQGVSTPDAYDHGAINLTYASSITFQVGARSKDAVTFNFAYNTNGIGNLKADLDASARGLGTEQLSLATQEEANFAVDKIDNAINKVSMIRATFGAAQNRLEHKIDNLNVSVENLTSAESAIRDTDMPTEMMNFTKQQILAQASQSMLAQANQLPQGVLSLLQ